MEHCLINSKRNFNNSNRSFNLSSHKRKKLWFYTLDLANSNQYRKTTSLNSFKKHLRRKSINDLDGAYSNYINKGSFINNEKLLRRSVTFSNINVCNSGDDKQSDGSETKTPVAPCLKKSKDNLLKQSIKSFIKQKASRVNRGDIGKKVFSKNLNKCDNTNRDNCFVQEENEYGINNVKSKYDDKIFVHGEGERFDSFFNYLEKQDVQHEKTNNVAVKQYVNNIKCIWGAKEEFENNHKKLKPKHRETPFYVRDDDTENKSKYPKIQLTETPTPTPQLPNNLHKKKDLTYDDRYLYGSLREDSSSNDDPRVIEKNKYCTQMLQKRKSDFDNKLLVPTEPTKKSNKSRSVHQLFTDVKNILPFQMKKSVKKKNLKKKISTRKSSLGDNLKFSNVGEFEDEFYNTSKYKFPDENDQSENCGRVPIESRNESTQSEQMIGNQGLRINQSVDLDDNEPAEIVEKYVLTEFTIDDCKSIDKIRRVNEKGESEPVGTNIKDQDYKVLDNSGSRVMHTTIGDRSNISAMKNIENEKENLHRSELLSSRYDLQSIVTSMTTDERLEVITMKIFDDLVSENKVTGLNRSSLMESRNPSITFGVTEQVTNKANKMEKMTSLIEKNECLTERTGLDKFIVPLKSESFKLETNEAISQIKIVDYKRFEDVLEDSFDKLPLKVKDRERNYDKSDDKRSDDDDLSLIKHCQLFPKDSVVYNNELIEAVSQNIPLYRENFQQQTPFDNNIDLDKLDCPSEKSEIHSMNQFIECSTVAVDITKKTELPMENNDRLPSQVDVFLEDFFLSCEPNPTPKRSNVKPMTTVRKPDRTLSSFLLTVTKPKKSTSTIRKTSIQSHYMGSMHSATFLSPRDFPPPNNMQTQIDSQNLYRSNEMLLHPTKLSMPISGPRNRKTNVNSNPRYNTNTKKNSFWCLPYNHQATPTICEKKLVTFSYKSTCADCKGKSFQSFQLVPQSPQNDGVLTSDNSTKNLQTQYNGDAIPSIDLSQETMCNNDVGDNSFAKFCGNRVTKKSMITEKTRNMLSQSLFEIQNPSEKSTRDVDNVSLYLEMEKRSKISANKNDILTADAHNSEPNKNPCLVDNQIVFVLKKGSSTEVSKDKKLNIEEDHKNNSKIVSPSNFRYETIVFGARLSPDSYSDDKSQKQIQDTKIPNEQNISTINDPPLSDRDQKDLKLVTDILNSNMYGLPPTNKESITVTHDYSNLYEHTKSTKLDFEYNDTIDMDDVPLDTYSRYPPTITINKDVYEDNSKFVDFVSSNILDQPKLYDQEPDLRNINEYRFKSNGTVESDNLSIDEQERYPQFNLMHNNSIDAKQRTSEILDIVDNDKNCHSKIVDTDMVISEREPNFPQQNDCSQIATKETKTVSKHSNLDSNGKVPEPAESSTEINTDRQILKESSRALKLKENESIDPEDLLISTYEPPTVGEPEPPVKVSCEHNETVPSLNKNDEKLSQKPLSKDSQSFIIKNETNSDEITLITDIQNRIPKTQNSFQFESNKSSEAQKNTDSSMCNAPIEEITKKALTDVLIELVDTLLNRHNVRLKPFIPRKFENTSSNDCSILTDTNKLTDNDTATVSANLCCYFCQCQIPHQNYEQHIKLCTETQKNLIVQSKIKPEKNEKNVKEKVVSAMSNTICFLCGCYFTKHSILIHEVACRKKWIRRNELLPKGQRKPIPVKPLISDEMIRENYEQEQHRGNNKFKLKDAVNKLIYQASLRNPIDFKT